MKRILINSSFGDELRVALVDGAKLYDFDTESPDKVLLKGSIFKATVSRVESSLDAAFVNFGSERHGFLPLKDLSSDSYKKNSNGKSECTLKECQEQHGLTTSNVWFESFNGLYPMTETYIRNMRANGEMINKNPRIKMSTIHGAKGGEADNVLLLQDLTGAAIETFSHDPDELHRLFYTGATRAKRELHVLDPRDFDRAYIL